MNQFTIDAPVTQFFVVEKFTDNGQEGDWTKVEEGQLFTGLDIVVGNRVLLANEKTFKSLWTSAVQEIVKTSPDVVFRTKNSTYRLRKI